MKGFWQPRDALQWEQRVILLEHQDGSVRDVEADGLIAVHKRLLKARNRPWIDLALAETRHMGQPSFDAFVTRSENAPVIVVSLGLLDAIGKDPDALAAVVSHEMAHVILGHNPDDLRAREEQLRKAQAVGPVSAGPAGVIALLIRVGATMHYRSLTREEERAADELGLDLAVKAGFDPCGLTRALSASGARQAAGVLFFPTHPDSGERRDTANRLSRQVNQRDCPEPAAPAVARAPEKPQPKAAETTLSPAQESYRSAMAAFRAGEHAAAVRQMHSLAASGHAPAQAQLGYWYYNGSAGLEKDEVQSVHWTRLAAEQGHAWAQGALGRMYRRGLGGLKKDEREALRLFSLSAAQGHPLAETEMGIFHLRGLAGLPQDRLEAARYFKRAADKGVAYAQGQLGWIYWNGIEGIPQDADEAVRLFRLSANQGNAIGQAGIARMYYLGAGGLAKDDAEALRLNRLAAEQGDATAQNNLGAMRENGEGGLPKDLEEAVVWYRRSAAQGNAGASGNLRRLGRE